MSPFETTSSSEASSTAPTPSATNAHPQILGATPELVSQIAAVTRMLRMSMQEMGLDNAITVAADAIPDARERLNYVARMTEQAANRVLNASEAIGPMQDKISGNAQSLRTTMESWLAGNEGSTSDPALMAMLQKGLAELKEIDGQAKDTNGLVMEIIMAQDFQDLTGQVIMRMLGVINSIETELIQVLITYLPEETREAKKKEIESLVNGPQIKPEGKPDVVSSQDQVDDLLSSLGF